MKVVFMGTPQFAVPSLEQLNEKHKVLAAVCQPDKPNKRGRKIVFGAVKQFALAHDIPVLQPETVKSDEFIAEIAKLAPDVIVVAAYGKILPKEILNLPRYGCINVHGSLLPKYRGAAPIQWAIINGDDVTGITIMHMSEGLDTGDMIEKHPMSIEVDDTYGTLLERMSQVGAQELIKALALLQEGTAKTIMQNDAEATYAPIIKKEIGHIRWSDTGKEIVNLIRGLNPVPGAYCEYEGEKLKVWKAKTFGVADETADFGQILDVNNRKGIVVNAKHERVLLLEVQASGSKKMSAVDYLRGHKVLPGQSLV